MRNLIQMPDEVLSCIMPYILDSGDRDAVSRVSRRWYELEALTRKHVTVAFCYSTTPERLTRRYVNIESLKLKGKPRASMFNLIPEDWGGYVTPWVDAIVRSFNGLKSLHFRRMIVTDADLKNLVSTRGGALETLKLDKCSGYSTDGLMHVGRFCRNLKTLYMEESAIDDIDGRWLHELASNNTVLENLNFYMTELARIDVRDLELLARNCRSLTSVKITECEILDLNSFFRTASKLEEFCGGSLTETQQLDRYTGVALPAKLTCVGLTYLGRNELHLVFPIAHQIKKLDLLYALLDQEDHLQLLQRCPNLEIFETRNVIGDRGLQVLSQHCTKLRRLRIERGADENDLEDEGGVVSHVGLTNLANGCIQLEYMAVYVSDVTNASLQNIGNRLKNLTDFRLVLLDRVVDMHDLPLDEGVYALLTGCQKIRRLALYLRHGCLSDMGLAFIGQHSQHVRWMLLSYVGESDDGLLEFANGCPSLQKLEMRGCIFSERALAIAATRLVSLRYLWVQGYRSTEDGRDLVEMDRPFWNIELIPRQVANVDDPNGGEPVLAEQASHLLAYYSLAGPRTDFPGTVVPFDPALFQGQ